MGATKSTSSSAAPTAAKAPTSAYGVKAPGDSGASSYRLGAAPSGSSGSYSGYLAKSQESGDDFQRPTSMVGEVRKAGSQIFNEALGVNTEGENEDAVKVPGVSTSRMAGEVLKGFTDKLAGQLDPTKAMEEETDPSRYGIGAPAKPEARYTASAAAPFG